jgi:Flp pilus assembly pilin Flp
MMMNVIHRLVKDHQGAETVEYALVAGFLAIAAVGAIAALGTTMLTYWTFISTTVSTAF